MATADELDPASSALAFFGTELRRVRAEAKMQQVELAKRLFVTPSLLSKIEAAVRVPSDDLATKLDEIFATGGHFERLWPLAIKLAYPPWFRPFVDLEAAASIIRSFQVQVVPGLLQTEDYARAVLEAGPLTDVDDVLTARLSRQRILDRAKPPELWVVLEENVLRRVIGSPKVMRGQLARLIQAAETRSNVIQVLPYSAGTHAALAGPFAALSFDEGEDVLYVEVWTQGQLVADPQHVKPAMRAYDLIRAAALSPHASIDLIASAMKDLDP